jgi:hypothetical protein
MRSGGDEATYLKPKWPTYGFLTYNIGMMFVSSALLILFLVESVYLSPAQFQAARVGEVAQSGATATPGAGSGQSATRPAMQSQAATGSEAVPSAMNASPSAGSNSTVVSGQAALPVQANRPESVLNDGRQAGLSFMLFTMLAAGCAGGTLCNLRGIFKYYRDEAGLPRRFVVPFIIRPFMGAAAGLLVFFVAAFFSDALSGRADAASLGWTTLSGRMPFVVLAILAGFGSQEFMERMKEVAKTTFSDAPREAKAMKIVEVARWTEGAAGPDALAAAGTDELVVMYGRFGDDGAKPERLKWDIWYPYEAIPKLRGPGTAVKIIGRTPIEREAMAEQMVQRIADEKDVKAERWHGLKTSNQPQA